MKTKYVFLAMAFVSVPTLAQETYENAKLVGNDLNGTARYVGMGGAMEALGADISTISSNPAGIGLFRHSELKVSASGVFQHETPSYASGDKSHASFDQVGFVWASRSDQNSFLNFGFNYHKSKNFDYILGAANHLSNASSNKLTYQKYRNGYFESDYNDAYKSSVDYLNLKGFNMENDKVNYVANAYQMNRENYGYIGDYDFNISANIDNCVYLGLTIGYKDVNYRYRGVYSESMVGDNQNYTVNYGDARQIDGDGVDVKFGLIVRPIETSAFRFGVYVQSPTWYDLTMNTQSYIQGSLSDKPVSESYDFKIVTPWRFGFSLGHTVGNYLALGATYEYADYGSTKTRINDGVEYSYDPYNWYGYDYYETSHNDKYMNDHTKETLKGVSLLKLGLEYKPVTNLAIRLGYNYESALYNKESSKGVYTSGNLIPSEGTYYTSSADYTNWKATNRFTCGLGYSLKGWSFDVAYQYSAQNGEFYPFTSYIDSIDAAEDNVPTMTEVKNNRSQLLFTLGYHF